MYDCIFFILTISLKLIPCARNKNTGVAFTDCQLQVQFLTWPDLIANTMSHMVRRSTVSSAGVALVWGYRAKAEEAIRMLAREDGAAGARGLSAAVHELGLGALALKEVRCPNNFRVPYGSHAVWHAWLAVWLPRRTCCCSFSNAGCWPLNADDATLPWEPSLPASRFRNLVFTC